MCEKALCEKKANNLKITNVAIVAMSQGFPRVHKFCISSNVTRAPKGYHRLPQVTKGHKCEIGLVWLSSYFESILALDLKNRFFVQILFEFFWK